MEEKNTREPGLGQSPELRPKLETHDGVPVWVHASTPVMVTSQLVRALLEDDPA